MENEPVITAAGMKALREKLEYLEGGRRREVSDQMKRALEHGDLSENAEYDEARKAYMRLEKEISETASLIARATVISDEDISTETVGVGSRVEVEHVEGDGGKQEFRLVGPTESNPSEGRISHESPIGAALMDARVGDTVLVRTPRGDKRFRITGISR